MKQWACQKVSIRYVNMGNAGYATHGVCENEIYWGGGEESIRQNEINQIAHAHTQ